MAGSFQRSVHDHKFGDGVVVSRMAGPQPQWPKASNESGYAILLVFLLAAILAVALYKELPRAAFEAQRSKEQLLIERGEQYKRAIQLFVRKVGRYPASLEELENLNNVRFLRKRYLDPMTGHEKWRLIHINGGVLTDSIIPKNKPEPDHQQANTNTFIAEGPVIGATNDPNPQQVTPALRRRASDDRPVITQEAPDQAAPADAGQENPASVSDNSNPDYLTTAAGTQGTAANMPAMQSQLAPGMPPGRSPQLGGQPAQIGMPGASPNQSSGGVNVGLSNPTNAGQSGGSTSGSSVFVAPSLGQSSSPNTASNGGQSGDPSPGSSVYVAPSLGQAAPDLPSGVTGLPGHGDILGNRDSRNQRLQQSAGASGQSGFVAASSGPASQNADGGFGGSNSDSGGASTLPTPGGMPGMAGAQVGGGIAGVASEATGLGIKVYNARKRYNEWEFVYDQTKDRGLAGVQRNGGTPGTPAQSMGSIPGQQPGMGGQSQPQPQQPPN